MHKKTGCQSLSSACPRGARSEVQAPRQDTPRPREGHFSGRRMDAAAALGYHSPSRRRTRSPSRAHSLVRNCGAGALPASFASRSQGEAPMPIVQTRRRLLTTLSLAGAAGLLRAPPARAAEGALETTTVRLQTPGLCVAPVYIAEEMLRVEGFTDIRYDDTSEFGAIAPVAHGTVDFAPIYASQSTRAIDAGERVTLLAGVMVGCFELFAREGIDSVAGLKGQSIGVGAAWSLSQQLVTLMAAQVGLDPANDVHWITDPKVKPLDLFAEGKIDAFLAYPPDSQELRARHVGRVIVNSGVDRPWSQYFCCMIAGNPDYIRAYPTATKLRAILKATDLCATEPARVARRLIDG